MSKKSIKVEDVLNFVMDDVVFTPLFQRIIDSLNERFEELFGDKITSKVSFTNTSIEKVVSESTEKFINPVAQKVDQLTRENCELKRLLDQSKKENTSLKQRLELTEKSSSNLSQRTEVLEINNRLDSLIFQGVPATYADVASSGECIPKPENDSVDQIISICHNKLGINLVNDDIESIKRIRRKTHANGITPPPMIVKFRSTNIRNKIYGLRKNLRSSSPDTPRIYINENLTPDNAKVYAQCRNLVKMKKLFSTWTFGGIVYAKLTPEKTEKPFQITKTSSILNSL